MTLLPWFLVGYVAGQLLSAAILLWHDRPMTRRQARDLSALMKEAWTP